MSFKDFTALLGKTAPQADARVQNSQGSQQPAAFSFAEALENWILPRLARTQSPTAAAQPR